MWIRLGAQQTVSMSIEHIIIYIMRSIVRTTRMHTLHNQTNNNIKVNYVLCLLLFFFLFLLILLLVCVWQQTTATRNNERKTVTIY